MQQIMLETAAETCHSLIFNRMSVTLKTNNRKPEEGFLMPPSTVRRANDGLSLCRLEVKFFEMTF